MLVILVCANIKIIDDMLWETNWACSNISQEFGILIICKSYTEIINISIATLTGHCLLGLQTRESRFTEITCVPELHSNEVLELGVSVRSQVCCVNASLESLGTWDGIVESK